MSFNNITFVVIRSEVKDEVCVREVEMITEVGEELR